MNRVNYVQQDINRFFKERSVYAREDIISKKGKILRYDLRLDYNPQYWPK
jgi:hypothetical protein